MVGRSAAQETAECKFTYTVERILVGDKVVRVELYHPTSPGSHPLALVLHGSAGVYTVRGSQPPSPSNLGEDALAKDCYVVALPHYFDAIGAVSVLDQARLKMLFPDLKKVVMAVLDTEAGLPDTRNRGILLCGESYGGFLAIAIAEDDSRVSAVSVYGAALPPGDFQPTRNHLPPLLIQHGENDTVVPLEGARRLSEIWQSSGAIAKLIVYPDVGHYFSVESRAQRLENTRRWFAQFAEPSSIHPY